VSIVDRIRPSRPATAAPPRAAEPSALERRRAELADRVAELQFDLGGLAYEMAIRDHFRLEVLVTRAAELQQADGELGEVDRLLRSERAGEAGSCPACGAPHSRGAGFCWQCGETLLPATAEVTAVST
jgi:hypothetical protein